jgi:uncharacterized protein (DUF1684 family)
MTDDRSAMTDGGHETEYADTLRENRAEKDEFFSTHPQSPIPPEDRDGFDGLSYFDPDPQYRVEATVTLFDDPEEIDFETSDGRTITYRRPFRFQFEISGETYELSGYRQDATDPIFVPFRDKTTGQPSYKDAPYM